MTGAKKVHGVRHLPGQWAAAALLLALAAWLAGCAYRGGLDNPVERRLSWFSYADGSDIRASCGEGTLDRYRLVYNGSYERQVRTYEVTADGADGAWLVARVSRGMDLARFSLDDPLGPWRWARAEARLSPAAFAALRDRLAASGLLEAPPVGLSLYSAGFYWVASGCRDGQFHFTAWRYPETDLARLAFVEVLLAHDGTGIALNPARPTPEAKLQQRGQPDEWDEQRFVLTVRENGFGRVVPPL